METRKTWFLATFHQKNMGKFWQPSPLVFMDRWEPNLVGWWRRVAEMGLGHWFPWQPHCCRVNVSCKWENALTPKILGQLCWILAWVVISIIYICLPKMNKIYPAVLEIGPDNLWSNWTSEKLIKQLTSCVKKINCCLAALRDAVSWWRQSQWQRDCLLDTDEPDISLTPQKYTEPEVNSVTKPYKIIIIFFNVFTVDSVIGIIIGGTFRLL